MNPWLQYGVLFLGASIIAFAIISLIRRFGSRPEEAFVEDEGDRPDTMVLGTMTEAFSEQFPATQTSRIEMAGELRTAGFYRPTALMEYRAVRTLLVLTAVVGTCVLALLVDESRLINTLLIGAVVIVLAYSVPRVYVNMQARRRARAIERGLPLAIDLLILCLTAGQNLVTALKLTARQLLPTHPVLAQELAITQRQAELHSLQYALKQWADRVPVPDVRNLALLLVQSEKLGTDAISTLQELADNFRTTARQRAEAQANRTSFWMLFPSVFCFWVAAAIILLAPAYLEFFQFRERSATFFNQVGPNLQRANQRNQPMVPAAQDQQ